MPVSSKKKRGKQRKAAKNQATEIENIRRRAVTTPDDSQLEALVSDRFALLISMGDHEATASLCSSEQTTTPLVKSGILSTVLSFVKCCESDSFDELVQAAYTERGLGIGPIGTLGYGVR